MERDIRDTTSLRGRFQRIDDCRYLDLMDRSYPIQEQWPAFGYYGRYGSRPPLNLAEYYAAMRVSFGDSGRLYDDWKGAFAFPFEMEITRNGKTYPYALKVVNWRSTVELRFSKVTGDSIGGLSLYRPPINEELSGYEMEVFDAYMYGWMRGLSCTIEWLDLPPFFATVESNCITYGHIDGEYFEHAFEEGEDFDRECAWLRAKMSASSSVGTWPEPLTNGWVDFEI